MKIEKVFYSKTYPLQLGSWEKVGLEASIEPGEDQREALYTLKKHVENFHYESNKAAEKQLEAAISPENVKISRIEAIIQDIQATTTIEGKDGLKSFYEAIKNNGELLAAYSIQLKKLQNA